MECLVYIQVLGTDMKIHPRTGSGIFGITACIIGFGLASVFKWDIDKTTLILMVICLVVNYFLYDFLYDKYYAKDDTSNDDTESDIKQNKDNNKKDSEE